MLDRICVFGLARMPWVGSVESSPVRMAIESGRWTMCSPTSVCNSGMRVEDLCHVRVFILDELLELGNLANLLESKDFIFLVTVDGKTGRIISSIFQTSEACEELMCHLRQNCTDARTIHQRFNDVLAVLFHQIIDIAKDTTVKTSFVSFVGCQSFGQAPTNHMIAVVYSLKIDRGIDVWTLLGSE